MPSPEPIGTWRFDVAWTTYRVAGPLDTAPVIDHVTPSTAAFWPPTHTVTYSITTANGSGYRLIEQGDDVGETGDTDWLTKILRRRVRARLHQIAGLAGWTPLDGTLVDMGPNRILLLTDPTDGDLVLDEMAVPDEVERLGRGTCLIRPDGAAVVGRSGLRGHRTGELAPCHPATDVVVADSGDDDTIRPSSTPRLMARILESVFDSASHPSAVPAAAVRALTGARAWHLTVRDRATTLGMIATLLG